MSLERHPKLKNIWTARVYPDGRKKDPSTGKASNKRSIFMFEGSEPAALDWYANILKGTRKTIPLAPSINYAWPDFCLYYKNRVAASTYNDYLKTWKRHLEPYFGQFRPGQLTPGLIENYKAKRGAETYLPGKTSQLPADDTPEQAKRRKPISKKRINNELFYLSAMVTWMASPGTNMALPLGWKITGYPARQTKAPLPIVPDRHEIIRFLRCMERRYRPMFIVWYYTGMRKTGLLTMTGERVNLQQKYIIAREKGDKERIIPIHRKIAVYIRKHWHPGVMWCNPKTGKPYIFLTRVIKRAADKAGLDKHMHIHLLRHSFGTHAIQSGIDIRSLQILIGHESVQTTEKYTTLGGLYLAEQMNKLGSKPMHQSKTPQPSGNK